MPDGGVLTIETKAVELDEAFAVTHLGVEPGPHVALLVSDTGVGMDAATQARIFEPFFTTKEAGRGTGLGLATVFGIVQQHEGTIWVDSAPGRGATFRIYLPASVDGLRAAPVPATALPPRVGGEVVLVCDDEPQVRELVRDVLSRDGFVVLCASSPEHAVEITREHEGPIDLLVTDVVMPRISGPRLAKQVAELRPDIRVLFVSGYTGERTGASEIDADAAFLPKPITPDALLAKVAAVLGR
jgi:CheY-like chemotaxis protein